jgi:hypothetical protein
LLFAIGRRRILPDQLVTKDSSVASFPQNDKTCEAVILRRPIPNFVVWQAIIGRRRILPDRLGTKDSSVASLPQNDKSCEAVIHSEEADTKNFVVWLRMTKPAKLSF